MNAFEQIVSDIMQRKNYWTRVGYKVELEKPEKVAIGTPSMPDLEIDVLAYKASSNELIWIECKSYLDSHGVRSEDLLPDGKYASRYKTFTDSNRREIAIKALKRQITKDGLAQSEPQVKLWLIAGKIAANNQDKLEEHFKSQGWEIKNYQWLLDELKKISEGSWDDNVSATVAKLFYRNQAGS